MGVTAWAYAVGALGHVGGDGKGHEDEVAGAEEDAEREVAAELVPDHEHQAQHYRRQQKHDAHLPPPHKHTCRQLQKFVAPLPRT
eukprot:1465545-Rhodomonas_salina.2